MTDAKTLTLTVISAGLTQPSSSRLLADRLAAATVDALAERGITADVEIVELRDHAHALTDNLLTGFAGGGLRAVIDRAAKSDGLIAVTPIFNASYSGLYKSFFDVLEQGTLDGMPTLLGATGGTGRHSLALEHAARPMFAYLRAATVPTAVYAASEDWAGSGDQGLAQRIERAAGELAAAMVARENVGPADPFANSVPFEELLSRQAH
ncbi:FMN reductase [Rhodococcus sp. AG1013]|uniref:FMN reductase n=1 Tax=unclassified Rhodococcus (in: high G+C Gram-positive bacteria) TaxID=192944 RepID=UPI000E0C7836|nr:FMN reductase [Rhodococcus sp. AG1013]RDI35771.1 FMN reductase [Rhodococcus sp. AG1013]